MKLNTDRIAVKATVLHDAIEACLNVTHCTVDPDDTFDKQLEASFRSASLDDCDCLDAEKYGTDAMVHVLNHGVVAMTYEKELCVTITPVHTGGNTYAPMWRFYKPATCGAFRALCTFVHKETQERLSKEVLDYILKHKEKGLHANALRILMMKGIGDDH